MKTGFYIGRFQPFHKGHLSAVQQALNKVDFLIIGIGSAQYSRTADNPFTAGERAAFIRDALVENSITEDRFTIIPIPDIHDNAEWPAYVQKLTPPFDVVFVGDDGLVKKLFEKHTDIPVTVVKKEVDSCATDIRKAMLEEGDWKKHLPKSTVKHLKRINGIERIKKSEL